MLQDDNVLVVRVEDIATDREQPRGKQYWKEKPEGIFYTGTTGIWQSVWLEPVGRSRLSRLKTTPDIDRAGVCTGYRVENAADGQEVEIVVSFQGEIVASAKADAADSGVLYLSLPDFPANAEARLWSPENPALHDLRVLIHENGESGDEVRSYFGMRKVSVESGQFLLNNRPYYMRLLLDQGYHPEGLLTMPSDEMLRRDVELVKEMGFNGVRKHQKVENPRFLLLQL